MFDLPAIQEALRRVRRSTAGCSTTSAAATCWPAGSSTWPTGRSPRGGSSTSSPPRGSRGSSSTGSSRRRSTTCRARRRSISAGRSWRPASGDWSAGRGRVAMEYAPGPSNPYIARVDAGTVELVRSLGVEVVPSGDLIQRFEAAWDDEQWAMHLEADRSHDRGVRRRLRPDRRADPRRRLDPARPRSRRRSWTTSTARPDDLFAADRRRRPPQRRPALRARSPGQDAEIRAGDFVLVDLWAKIDRPGPSTAT